MSDAFWIISSMDTVPSEDGLTDVVKYVYWTRQKNIIYNDLEYSANTFGCMECSPPDPMVFTPYQDLTFDQICGWLDANLDVLEIDAEIDVRIEKQINPPTISLPLPWNTTTSTTTTIISK